MRVLRFAAVDFIDFFMDDKCFNISKQFVCIWGGIDSRFADGMVLHRAIQRI